MIAQLAAAVMLAGHPAARASADSIPKPASDAWFSPDKAKHFMLAGFVESSVFAALESAGMSRENAIVGAVGVAAAVSLGREVHDRKVKNQFSFRDLAWDLAGAAAAFAVIRHTDPRR